MRAPAEPASRRSGAVATEAMLRRHPVLDAAFFTRPTLRVARALLGKVFVHRTAAGTTAGRIVEVEAYRGPSDRAAHTAGGRRTPRNEVMWGPGGRLYVYFTYGMHWCMNVVTQEADLAEAVLLRAAEPVRGIESMRARRPKAKRDVDLMNGPGKLCAALAIDRALDGEPLDGPRLFLTARDVAVSEDDIAVSPRIGIDNSGDAAHWPLRFFLRGNRYVSKLSPRA